MSFIKNIFANHKSKTLLFFALVFVFVVAFFPYDDMGDLITSELAAATNNTVYLQFEDLAVGFLPQPGIKMSNILFESPVISEIRADSLRVAPSILAGIKQLPLGRIKADNLFKGNLDLTTSTSSKIKAPKAISADIEYTNFDLNSVVKAFVPFPMKAQGSASIVGNVDLDLEMQSQPDGQVQLTSQKVFVPAFNLDLKSPSANGREVTQTISIPSLNLGNVKIKGTIKNGKIVFSDTVIGSSASDVFAKIGGDMDLRVTPAGAIPTYYNLQIDVTFKDAFLKNLGPYSTMLDLAIGKHKKEAGLVDGKRYAFRLQMNPSVDAAPNFAPY